MTKLRQAIRQRGVFLTADEARMLLAIVLRAHWQAPIHPPSRQHDAEKALVDRFQRRCEELR